MIPCSVEDLIRVGDKSIDIIVCAVGRFLVVLLFSYGIHFVCGLVLPDSFTPSTYILTQCLAVISFLFIPYLTKLIVQLCLLLSVFVRKGHKLIRPLVVEVFLLIEWAWYVTTYIVTTELLLRYRGGLGNLIETGLGLVSLISTGLSSIAGFIWICLFLSGDTRAQVRGESTIAFATHISGAALASGGYTVCWLAFRLVQFSQTWVESVRRRFIDLPSNVASGKEYKYCALDSSQMIRLLRLRRSTPFSRVTCTLIVTPLSSAPSFEAISYTWGGQVADRHITLEDDSWLAITANAFNIILERTSILKPRYIWLDAICINQADPNEKRSQVEIMGEIYSTASRVVVWLGNPHSNGIKVDENIETPVAVTRDEATVALNFLYVFGQIIRERTKPSNEPTTAIGTRVDWVALTRLLCNPYWNRAWILQEVAHGRQVDVLYGGYHIDWVQLLFTLRIFEHDGARKLLLKETTKYNLLPDQVKYPAIEQVRQFTVLQEHVRRSELPGIVNAMKITIRSKATDPRDKVFALYSLITPHQRIVPDYGLSAEEVYVAIAKGFQNAEPASTLQLAGIGYGRKLKDLPSWVPDWTALPRFHNALAPYKAGSCHYGVGLLGDIVDVRLVHEPDPRLHLIAVPISQLRLLSDPCPLANLYHSLASQGTGQQARDLQFWVVNAINILEANMPLTYARTGQLRREAIWRTLIGDLGWVDQPGSDGSWVHPAPHDPFAGLYDTYIEKAVPRLVALAAGITTEDKDYDSVTPKFVQFVQAVLAASMTRRVAITDDETITLVPEFAKRDDWVCVVPGVTFPVILREVPENGQSSEDLWQFVGDSYAHGLMDGEAFEEGGVALREFTLI